MLTPSYPALLFKTSFSLSSFHFFNSCFCFKKKFHLTKVVHMAGSLSSYQHFWFLRKEKNEQKKKAFIFIKDRNMAPAFDE